jgi:nicotinic acid mononucleotide adenylyltransferase
MKKFKQFSKEKESADKDDDKSPVSKDSVTGDDDMPVKKKSLKDDDDARGNPDDPEDNADADEKQDDENPFAKKKSLNDDPEEGGEVDPLEADAEEDELNSKEEDVSPVEGPRTLTGQPKDLVLINPTGDESDESKPDDEKDNDTNKFDANDKDGSGNPENPDDKEPVLTGNDADENDEDGKPDEKSNNDEPDSDNDKSGKDRSPVKKKKLNIADDGDDSEEEDDEDAETGPSKGKKPTPDKDSKGKKKKSTVKIKVSESAGQDRSVIVFGRMNPIQSGHYHLVQEAAKYGRPTVYLTKTDGNDANPLPYEEKIKLAEQAFGGIADVGRFTGGTLFHVVEQLYTDGVKSLVVVLGEDRAAEMRRLLEAYNGKQYHFDKIEVVSVPRTDISATQMRKFVVEGKREDFTNNLPEPLRESADAIFTQLQSKLVEERLSPEQLIRKMLAPK